MLKELAEDLYERGGIDIRETFIDGSFTLAKKGAVLSAIQSVEKGPRSWQLQTLLVFLSPLAYKALRPDPLERIEHKIVSRFLCEIAIYRIFNERQVRGDISYGF